MLVRSRRSVTARLPSSKGKWLVYTAAAVLAVIAVALLAIAWSIRSGVNRAGEAALREFPGDRVLALVAYAEANHHAWADRNRAVWALGRLRDTRALPMLERHYVGEPCDHAQMLCQYELRKAINLIRKGHAR